MSRPFIAYGDVYSGNYDTLAEAQAVVDRNHQIGLEGAVYVDIDSFVYVPMGFGGDLRIRDHFMHPLLKQMEKGRRN